MAAVTSTILGAGLSAYQIAQGAKDKRQAQSDLGNFKRQGLENPYANMQISTVGSDLMREESGRTTSNLVDASRGDIRSIMGNIPQIVSLDNTANRNEQAYLDDQVQKRNYAAAGDQTAIRGIQEQRDNMDLSGIGTRLNVGRQDMWNGMRGLMSSAMYGANNINFKGTPSNNPSATMLQPMGSNNIISGAQTPSAPVPNIPSASNFNDIWNNNFYGF